MADPSTTVSVAVEPDARSDWTLSDGVFGKFGEHLGSAMYPGVYEDYVTNGCFEVWNTVEGGGPDGNAFPETPEHDDTAYPWEPLEREGEVTLSQKEGGVRGREYDDALEGDLGIPDRYGPDPEGVAGPRFQRVTVDGEGGVAQRVALPDYRTDGFDVSVSVRGDDLAACSVALTTPGDAVLAEAILPVTDDWERHEVTLSLGDESPERYRESRYGEYRLVLSASGTGTVDFDWATCLPDDAVEGIYNPETIDLLKEYDVTNVRWPGGNYASQYRWRHGVGPVAERPVVPIVNWGGLEPNYLGTNEWLRFCELADVEPYLTVPFWSPAGPEAAAEWVEYVNGDPDETELGALRAEHGYEEPWDVEWWGVGNEVWGDFQVGGTDAVDYAERYAEYHDAMRAVDPDIRLDASAIDPWLTTVHDGSYEDRRRGERPVWNDLLFEHAPDSLEGVDVHRYTVGLDGEDPDDREAWLDEHDEDPVGYNELLVNFPRAWADMFADLRESATEHGHPDLRITAGEWELVPSTNDDWPSARRGTMAHGTYAARTFQTFVNHGDAIRLGHWTDFSLFLHPDPDRNLPPHPGARVQKAFADPIVESDADWYRVETDVTGSPTRDHPKAGYSNLDRDDIDLVDAVSVGGEAGLATWLVNGSLRESVTVDLDYGETCAGADAAVIRFSGADGDPFAVQESWEELDGLVREEFPLSLSADGTGSVDLPPAGVAVVRFDEELSADPTAG
jgi:alpha-N-arabinofuranosidase